MRDVGLRDASWRRAVMSTEDGQDLEGQMKALQVPSNHKSRVASIKLASLGERQSCLRNSGPLAMTLILSKCGLSYLLFLASPCPLSGDEEIAV